MRFDWNSRIIKGIKLAIKLAIKRAIPLKTDDDNSNKTEN